MTNLAIPVTLAANTTASATDVMTDFSAISTWLNNRDNATDYWLNLKISATTANPVEFKSSNTSCEVDIDCTGTNGTPILTWRRSGTTYFTLGVDPTNSNAMTLGTTALTTNIAFEIPSVGQQVQFQPGSTALPGISTIGDPNTGIQAVPSGVWRWISDGTVSGAFTGQGFAIPDGTVAAPSLYLLNSTSSGLSRGGSNILSINTNGASGALIQLRSNGDIITTQLAPLATGATAGFFYLPTVGGTPSGTPSSYTGNAPVLIDTTGSKIWVYIGGWKSVAVA